MLASAGMTITKYCINYQNVTPAKAGVQYRRLDYVAGLSTFPLLLLIVLELKKEHSVP